VKKKLDYISSLGCSAIWLSAVFQNDGANYRGDSPLDFTLLDDRLGTVDELRTLVTAAHKRGLYVVIEVIVNHLDSLLFEDGYMGRTAPFRLHNAEYRLFWKDMQRTYEDFWVNNQFIPEGRYETIINRDGEPQMDSYAQGSYWLSDFNHNGGIDDPQSPWQLILGRQSDFDMLRISHPRVQDKIIAMSNTLIASADIDGLYVNSVERLPASFLNRWSPAVKDFAANLGKKNFVIFGHVDSGDPRSVLSIGRGPFRETTAKTSEHEQTQPATLLDFGLNDRLYRGIIQPIFKTGKLGSLQDAESIYAADEARLDLLDRNLGHESYRMLNYTNDLDGRRLASGVEDGARLSLLAVGWSIFWPGMPVIRFGDEQGFAARGTGDGVDHEYLSASLAWLGDRKSVV
jgi:glycosidase